MFKCPVCGKTKNKKQDMINHVETEHLNEIPENMSTAQYLYYKKFGRDYGLCRICGKPTPWNEKAGKPSQICGSPECKAKVRQIAQERMLKVYGKTSLMNDMEHQEKMLAHRKISGTYLWSDHKHKFTYTGSYEKFAIEWLDKVMELNPDKIQMPGPILPYEYNGEIKSWITDIYLEDFNLIIEIKSSKNENTHPGFEHNRELEAAKDKSMQKQNQFNYIKITGKNMMSLVAILSQIRMNNITIGEDTKPVIMINESVNVPDNDELKSNITNNRIKSICEAINNEYAMSIANLSPITTIGAGVDMDNNISNSLIDKLKHIKSNFIKKANETIEPRDPQDNIISDNHEVNAPDPLVASNNFIENEEVRVDLESDPYNTEVPDPLTTIGQNNIKSMFD